MFNRRKRRSAKGSSRDVAGVLLAENGPSALENRALHDDAPVDEHIRARAYQLYLERGAQPNDDLRDWLRAERELTKYPPTR